ncbi:MAG: O-antigen ligase family protein [Actinobacteria bacterium]|nr:O-antigen ligase family protein [Actinomycetota bacterium]
MSTAAQLAGLGGAFGLAVLLLARHRLARLAGLGVWGGALGVLGLYLLPDLSRAMLVAGLVGGLAVAVGIAVLLRLRPYALAFATLACLPLRIPVDIGSEEVNLLLPLYAVLGGLALSLGWALVRDDERSRELGPLAWPLAAFVAWTGLSLLWTVDVRRGAIFFGAFVLPFGLLAIGFARLPWRGRWLTWLWGGLVATALAFAAVGGYQWVTRDVFWNPSVEVFNAYAPFFRVNSVFWDPSVYGRYLTVAILASLAGIVLGGVRGRRVLALYAVVVATWIGVLLSFSQSSFVALAAGILMAVAVAWGRRTTLALVGLGAATLVVCVAVPQIRDEVVGKSRAELNRITSGRANLVGQGVRIARDHPVQGVGAGGFSREYARRLGIPGRDPKRVASHTTPVTVAAEEGVVGLGLLAWLVATALLVTLRGLGRGFTSRVSLAIGIVLCAIAVHSVFYAAFFEDPMTWALFGLVGLASRVPRKPPVHTGIPPREPPVERPESVRAA